MCWRTPFARATTTSPALSRESVLWSHHYQLHAECLRVALRALIRAHMHRLRRPLYCCAQRDTHAHLNESHIAKKRTPCATRWCCWLRLNQPMIVATTVLAQRLCIQALQPPPWRSKLPRARPSTAYRKFNLKFNISIYKILRKKITKTLIYISHYLTCVSIRTDSWLHTCIKSNENAQKKKLSLKIENFPI